MKTPHPTSPLAEHTAGNQARDMTIYDPYNPIPSSAVNGSRNDYAVECRSIGDCESAERAGDKCFVSQVETAARKSTAMKKGSSSYIVSSNKSILALPSFCMKDRDLSNRNL